MQSVCKRKRSPSSEASSSLKNQTPKKRSPLRDRNNQQCASADYTPKKSVDAGLLSILECPICCDTMRGQIIQCENGHKICEACCKRLTTKRCPTCRQNVGNIRCRALEEVYLASQVTCPNHTYGCPEIDSGFNMNVHEAKCEFTPVVCPFKNMARASCTWRGDASEVVDHLREVHSSLPIRFPGPRLCDRKSDICTGNGYWINLLQPPRSPAYTSNHQGTFLAVCRWWPSGSGKHFHCVLRHIEHTEPVAYKVDVEHREGKGSLSWKGFTRSIKEPWGTEGEFCLLLTEQQFRAFMWTDGDGVQRFYPKFSLM